MLSAHKIEYLKDLDGNPFDGGILYNIKTFILMGSVDIRWRLFPTKQKVIPPKNLDYLYA
jgi:hypothetical protein